MPSTRVKPPVGPSQFFFSNNRVMVLEHPKRYARCEHDPRHFENKRSYKSDPIKTIFQKLADVPWMRMCHVNPALCKVVLLGCQDLHVNRAISRSFTTSRCSKVSSALCHIDSAIFFAYVWCDAPRPRHKEPHVKI